jgi:D-alanyl-lipoteichoic acid acyltransferase DltB (MBOAT superfamily)
MLVLAGLFRKCVVADQCALLANAAFSGQLGRPSLLVLLIGTYAFAWQIYGDFSGYSDIARGSAQLLGFHFMVNFRQPYLAQSFQDFWRRWHISLSTWLRDYLYIPLGGNRRGEVQTYRNLLTTMLLGGLWHGANWTFVIWGGMHGMLLSVARWFRGRSVGDRTGDEAPGGVASLLSPIGWARRVVVFHVVCVAWVFFRAPSLGSAVSLLEGSTTLVWAPAYLTAFKFLVAAVAPLFVIDLILEATGEEYVFAGGRYAPRFAAGAVLLSMVALFAASDANAFIYFQF